MNKTITIAVNNKIAKNLTPGVLYVCGNSDFIVNFAFDDEWTAFATKTARFITQHNTYTDVVFSGNTCKMPVMKNTHLVNVGVYAGNLSTTTPAVIPAKKSILCGSGLPADPAPDVYSQIMDALNQLAARIAALEHGGGNAGIDTTISILGVATLGNMKLS